MSQKKLCGAKCYAVLVIALIPCCSQKSSEKGHEQQYFTYKRFSERSKGAEKLVGREVPSPHIGCQPAHPNTSKKAVFDVRDWAQNVINANGGYFEKV